MIREVRFEDITSVEAPKISRNQSTTGSHEKRY